MGHGKFVGARVAVVGLQRSNAAVVRYLMAEGARAEVYDRQPAAELGPALAEIPPDAPRHCGPTYLDDLAARLPGLAAIFVTPGMRKDLPVFQMARAAGIPLWTEAAYCLRLAPCPTIGITGSAGKTTTTTLVGEAVRRHRPGSLVGGNIGRPLLDRIGALAPDDWMVLELSSFQLELAQDSPRLAAVLNVRPNHLDLHGSYQAYVEAKRQIYRHQRPGDLALFNADDPESAHLAAEAPAGRLWFSARGPVPAGVGLEGGCFRWWPPDGGAPENLLRAEDVRLPGGHNLENVAAALALGRAATIPGTVLAEVIADFRGVPHRLETVARWGGALWINDSIATSPDRTLAALNTFPTGEIVLLAGGYDKGLAFDALGRAVAHRCTRVLLFGTTAPKLAQAIADGAAALGRGPQVQQVANLDEAVAQAACALRPGQIVLLSPACASYDQFRDFEQRGARFREVVEGLMGSGGNAVGG